MYLPPQTPHHGFLPSETVLHLIEWTQSGEYNHCPDLDLRFIGEPHVVVRDTAPVARVSSIPGFSSHPWLKESSSVAVSFYATPQVAPRSFCLQISLSALVSDYERFREPRVQAWRAFALQKHCRECFGAFEAQYHARQAASVSIVTRLD